MRRMSRDLNIHHGSFPKDGEFDFVGKTILEISFRGASLSSHTKRVCMLLISGLSIVEQSMTAWSKSARFVATVGKGHEEKKFIHKDKRRFDLQALDIGKRYA